MIQITHKELQNLGYVFFRDRKDIDNHMWREFYLRDEIEDFKIILRIYINSDRIILYKMEHPVEEVDFMDKRFDGECPDIETLLLLHKLIGIK